MNTAAHAEEGVSAVPLLNAVYCAGCETISNSPHEACTICGSHSLISLCRLLGGTLQSQKVQVATAKYNLELTAKVHEVPATELNQLIQSITHLAEVGGHLEWLHINAECVLDTKDALRAA
jgi:hypothetical protein